MLIFIFYYIYVFVLFIKFIKIPPFPYLENSVTKRHYMSEFKFNLEIKKDKKDLQSF
jgi:hypothetical protein